MFETDVDNGSESAPADQTNTDVTTEESSTLEQEGVNDPWMEFQESQSQEQDVSDQGDGQPPVASDAQDDAEPPAAEEGFENLDMTNVTENAQTRIRDLVNRSKTAESELEQVRGQYNQMTNGLNSEEVNQALEIMRLSKSDPAKALEQLAPMFSNLAVQSGQLLPADLQQHVNNGEITEEAAKAFAQERVKRELLERQLSDQSKSQQQQEQEQVRVRFQEQGNALEAELQADPDYAAVKPYFEDRMQSVLTRYAQAVQAGTAEPLTPESMAQMARKIYGEVKTGIVSTRKPAARTPMTSGSPLQGQHKAEAKSMTEAQNNAWDAFG